MATLYNSPEDSITPVNKIHYTLEDIEGISAKGGGNGDVTIFYSTRHIEKSFAENDTAKLFFETRGVLLHELTHAYQLEPQGIGSYGTNRVFWAFIEGMADAVRVANGGKEETTWTVIGQQVISSSGCATIKILNSCVSLTVAHWR